jgi:xylitol oxidase
MFAVAGARLHWGKHLPLSFAETARMYPRMEAFRQFCMQRDPAGVFRNAYTERVLGLAPGRVQYIARQA